MKISENTSISISLVITVLAAVAWLTTIHNTGVANAAAINEIKISRTANGEKYQMTLLSIESRLARMETNIEKLLKRKTEDK